MKYLALILLISCSIAYAATPLDSHQQHKTVTLDYLLESCTVIGETAGGMIPHFDCESYLYGVLDEHIAIRKQLPVQQRACFPDDIAPWQVYQDILSNLPNNQGDKAAATVIMTILRAKYPCT